MLITNADDWGRSITETEAALACYEQGAVTSVSAMVFMKDSERAAGIAKETNLDTGLHLNFTEPFTGNGVTESLAVAQSRIARFLKRSKYALVIYQPLLTADFRFVYEAQASEFQRLYGTNPTHLDGHQHMHLCSNMLLDRILPPGVKVRRSFSFWPGEKSALNRSYRRWVDWCLASRHQVADYFFSLAQCLDAGRLPRVVSLARSWNVELMTHPFNERESRFLLSAQWIGARDGVQSGSFARL